MERLHAALDKMHQILTHLSEVLPGAGGIGGMLTAMKMDIDAAKAEMNTPAPEPVAKKGR